MQAAKLPDRERLFAAAMQQITVYLVQVSNLFGIGAYDEVIRFQEMSCCKSLSVQHCRTALQADDAASVCAYAHLPQVLMQVSA